MVFEHLFEHAASQGREVAIVDERGRHTYRQLADLAAGLGAIVSARTREDKVGVLLPPGLGGVASFYGTFVAGKSVVPINYLLGDREIAHIVSDSGIDTVISAPPLMGRVAGLGVTVIDLTQVSVEGTGDTGTGGNGAPKFPAVGADDVAVVIYTSGTSGLPKGVMLTYGNLQSDVDACIEHAQLRHRHKFLGVVPLFHSFGMTATMLAPIQLGSTIVYLGRFSAVACLNAVREHGVSIVFGVPSMFGAIGHLKSATAGDFANTYALISGGEPLPPALRESFLARFGRPILEGYGLTETSPVVSLNVPQASRPGSVGRPVPGAEFRIVDEAGKEVAAGEAWDLWVRGPMIMKGYLNMPEETARVMTADGFFKTGDLGKVDADGYVYITGRRKEMIIVAGEKVFPREVEDALLEHPAVEEAAVVGRKDAARGEVVVAFVIAKEGETLTAEGVREFCRTRGMPPWKTPREVHVVGDLPRSPTGKVLKRVLVDQLKDEG